MYSINTKGIIVTSASNLVDLNPDRPAGTGEAIKDWKTGYTETPDPLWASLNAGKSWSPPDSGMAISNIQLQGVDGVDGVCFQVSMGSDNGLSNNMCSGPSTTPPAPTTKIPPANTSDFRVPPATAAGVKGTTTGGKDDTTTDGTTIDAATVGITSPGASTGAGSDSSTASAGSRSNNSSTTGSGASTTTPGTTTVTEGNGIDDAADSGATATSVLRFAFVATVAVLAQVI